MILNESGLVRAIKAAYKKRGGYTVYTDGEMLTIYTREWIVSVQLDQCPKKVLATIVEQTGRLPMKDVPLMIADKGEPQTVLLDSVLDDLRIWDPEEEESAARMTTVSAVGYSVFQLQDLAVIGVEEELLSLVGAQVLVDQSAWVKREHRLIRWVSEGETIAVHIFRPTELAGWGESMMTFWAGLEKINLLGISK